MSFISLGLSESLLMALAELGYEQPTEIQHKTIPAVLQGRDLLAAAETGSGKTAGFMLPMLQQLLALSPAAANQATMLVLVPTRELALQVEQAVRQYGRFFPRQLKTLAVYGGVSVNVQMQALRSGCDIVVATPGRLLDLLARNALNLRAVKSLVLDEADRMLDLGFSEELNQLLALLPKKRQNLLFSATFPEEVQSLIDQLLVDPVRIELEQDSHIPEQLTQRAIEVDHEQRTALLKHLLLETSGAQFLVFVASKRTANNVVLKLERAGFSAQALHGDLAQTDRNNALAEFKAGLCRVLVATDLAARGIDIPLLPYVVNYDLPRSPADYVHRIGRTARAGVSGVAFSFIDHESDAHFKLIEKRNALNVPREQIKGFERNPNIEVAGPKTKGQAPVKGKRKSKKDKLREAAAAATPVNQSIWNKKAN